MDLHAAGHAVGGECACGRANEEDEEEEEEGEGIEKGKKKGSSLHGRGCWTCMQRGML